MKEIHGIDLSSLQIIKLKSVNFSSKTDSLSMEVTNHSFSGSHRIELKNFKTWDQDQEKFPNHGPDWTRTNKNLKISDRFGPAGPWIPAK